MASHWPRLVPLLALLYLPFVGGGLLTDDFAHATHLSSIDSHARLIDQPDTFGFYRPVTQASLAVAPGVRWASPVQARGAERRPARPRDRDGLSRLASRAAVDSAAGLATLAFALTPKAPSIAVLWISARGELLMALFSLAAIAAWIVWTRKGRAWWLVDCARRVRARASQQGDRHTAAACAAADTPVRAAIRGARRGGDGVRHSRARHLCLAIADRRINAVRRRRALQSGHLLALWLRNATNYTGRMIVAPIALVVLLGLVRGSCIVDRARQPPRQPADAYALRSKAALVSPPRSSCSFLRRCCRSHCAASCISICRCSACA